MPSPERTLFDKYLARAFDVSRRPLSSHQLAAECEKDIQHDGRDAKTTVYMKGDRGLCLKNRRRLFPGAPLGEVQSGGFGNSLLSVSFPSIGLLNALGGISHSALATYYLRKSDPPYPDRISLSLAVQLAEYIVVHVEINPDIVESIYNGQPATLRTAHSIAHCLLLVEEEARKHRWKNVDLGRWKSANLTYPVLEPKHAHARGAQKPSGTVARLSPRQVNLLNLFYRADEEGKQHIEQAAVFAARTHGTGGNTP